MLTFLLFLATLLSTATVEPSQPVKPKPSGPQCGCPDNPFTGPGAAPVHLFMPQPALAFTEPNGQPTGSPEPSPQPGPPHGWPKVRA